ncbi:MAG: protein kinase [Bryobacteraceae bacterium]
MTGEQRAQLKRVLNQALDLDEPQRSAYIEEACARDPELRRELQEILEGRGPSKGFLVDDASSGLPHVFREGQTLAGRFRVIRFRGRGGMGEVYECWDDRLRLRVGLKTIRSDWRPDSDARERFNREILVAREVSHPNLCRVFDMIEHTQPDGSIITCLTMEWLEGETLQAVLERERPMSTEKALPILKQVAAALDALHAARIVHRDLKPGNIMLVEQADGSTRAVVTDFGLAKPLEDREWYKTKSDAQAGAPYFMAPEQLRNEKATAASDIYAFGLVMDEMVTRTRAFQADSLGSLIYQRLWEQPIRPSVRSEGLPERWQWAILQCLEIEPAHRCPSAGFVFALVADDAPKPAPVSGRRQSRRAWYGAALVPLLAGGLLFGVLPPPFHASLVVFQINDMANDPAYKHLPSGMASELVMRLTKVEGLSVKQYYRTREKAPLDAVHDRFQLDGDLQKHGPMVRLTLRLTDSEKGNAVIWSERFDRNLDNPLELETEIANNVVQGLQKQVFSEAPGPARVQYAGMRSVQSVREMFGWRAAQDPVTQSPAAYHFYLRGRQMLDDRSPAHVEQAIQLFESAIREDRNFGLAYAALCDAYRAQVDTRRGDQEALTRQAKEAAEQAVRLNPLAPEAHAALAGVKQMMWDWEGSEASYKEAIRLDPKSPVAYRRYGGLIIQFGRFEEALALVRKGLELDPYDYPAHSAYGMCLMLARRYKEAEEHLKWTLAQRDFLNAHTILGSVYALEGQSSAGAEAKSYFELALREAEQVRSLEERGDPVAGPLRTPFSDYMTAMYSAMRGDVAGAQTALQRLTNYAHIGRISPVSLALVYGQLREKERAAAHLLEAERIKDRGLLYLKVLPLWDPIRDTDGYRRAMLSMRL